MYKCRDTVTGYRTCTVDVHSAIYSNNPELNSWSTKRRDARLLNPAALFSGINPVPIVQEAGWAPEPVGTGTDNLAPTGIQTPDRTARSQSLYRVRYPVHLY